MSAENSQEEFTIRKEQVYDREETAAALFGWTVEELMTVGGASLLIMMLIPVNWLRLSLIILVFMWTRKLKKLFPERFLSNVIKFYTRPTHYYRANAPDTEWRSPIS